MGLLFNRTTKNHAIPVDPINSPWHLTFENTTDPPVFIVFVFQKCNFKNKTKNQIPQQGSFRCLTKWRETCLESPYLLYLWAQSWHQVPLGRGRFLLMVSLQSSDGLSMQGISCRGLSRQKLLSRLGANSLQRDEFHPWSRFFWLGVCVCLSLLSWALKLGCPSESKDSCFASFNLLCCLGFFALLFELQRIFHNAFGTDVQF